MNTIILDSESQIKEQIVKNANDISSLKSNVKWIYQYGGVGGSGGGSGTKEVEWSLNVTLDNKILLADTNVQNEIILSSDSERNLVIQINKPDGKTFYIEHIYYWNGLKEIDLCDTLSKSARTLESGKYKFEKNKLNIQGNGELRIEVSCPDEATSHTVNYVCITNPLIINVNYVIKQQNKYNKFSSVNIQDVQNSEGIFIEFDYKFYTHSGNLYYQILNSSLDLIDIEINEKTLLENKINKVYFPIDLSNINYGYQLFSMNIIIDEEGKEYDPYNYTISCTIIPNEMYLEVLPVDHTQLIYKNEQDINNQYLYTFTSGIYGFDLTPYSGKNIITNDKFDICCIKTEQNDLNHIVLPELEDFITANGDLNQNNNILVQSQSTNVQELLTISHQINLVLNEIDDNVHLITLSFIMKHNNTYSKIEHFYIYVIKNIEHVDWYRDDINNNANNVFNYWRSQTCKGNFSNLSLFTSSQYLQFRKTDQPLTLINFQNSKTSDNVIIHIGIQYSDINNDDDILFTINEVNNNNISVSQNKLTVGTNSVTIYIPKDENYAALNLYQYHLLSIVKHKLYDNVYTITVYIDGVIENAIDILYNSSTKLSFTNIQTNKANFAFNLLEISYINDQITDNDIARYWYAYFDTFIANNEEYGANKDAVNVGKALVNYVESLEYKENNIIEIANTNQNDGFSIVNNIALNVNTPVLLLDYNNKDGGEYDNFIRWFMSTYGENAVIESKSVSVYYSPGKQELGEQIPIPNNTEFYIEPQGSSTLNFFAKNLNLGIRNTSEQNTIPIFTPNFDKTNYNSFLPETKFTLKTDIVDSSHSNNTSMGKFINENTTKFSNATLEDGNSKYVNHVKNCLLGFPILVFIRVRINAPTEQGQPDVPENFKFYYLGVYNFNLGRDSYFNMGYHYLLNDNNEEVLEYNSNNLFNNDGKFGVYQINKNDDELKDNLIITEIQGGNSYFDFSQWHESILFQGNAKNSLYMLGDFVPKMYNDTIPADGKLTVTDRGEKTKKILTELIKNISITGGLLFETLHKNFGPQSDEYNRSINTSDRLFESYNQVPNCWEQYAFNFNKKDNPDLAYTQDIAATEIMANAHNQSLLGYLNVLIKNESKNEDDEKPTPWIDYRSLIEYYVICMVFGLVDSVQKNLNLKSWNARIEGNDPKATFYTAFYDMDTCLGRDNGGSPVEYFAFSDYWNASIKDGILSEVSIYRDFYPKHTDDNAVPIGYDIPSSYLFAIAKYTRLSLSGLDDYSTNNYPSPNMIYAMWRNSENGNLGKGSLKNAKYFVNTYFDTLKDIPASLLNHNYRFKYLHIEKNNNVVAFNTDNKKPFHGRGIYSVIEWLNNRLHLLDAYFNLYGVNMPIQYYDPNEDKWNILIDSTSGNNITLNEFNNDGNDIYTPDQHNSDILLFSQIFGQVSKINRNVQIQIQSKKWAPFAINSSQWTSQYLIPESNTSFNIKISNTGNQQLRLGGSQYFTYIDNIGVFVEDVGINITSKYLSNIYMNYAINSEPNKWSFNTPSVNNISMNNPNYKGTLSNLDNNDNDLLLNLESVSLANSSVSLNFNNNGFSTLDISGTHAGNGITIYNCNNFNKLLYNLSTDIKSLNTVIWEENIVLNDFNCESINISSNIINNENKFPNATIEIRNIVNLESVNLSGFKSIIIDNCPSLTSIILDKNVETLQICNVKLNRLSSIESNNIYKDTDDNLHKSRLNLSKLTNLKAISFTESTGFYSILLPNKEIKLLYKAFFETDLTYIDFADNAIEGTLVLCDNGTDTTSGDDCKIFYNSNFSLQSGDNTELIFKVQEKPTSLSELFALKKQNTSQGYHNATSQLNYERVVAFINNLGNKEYVTSLYKAFYRQAGISAYINALDNHPEAKVYLVKNIDGTYDNSIGSKFISFKGYNRLSSVESCFEYCNINFVHKNMFTDINIESSIDIQNFIDYNNLMYVHKDAFKPIKGYYHTFLFNGTDENNIIRFVKYLYIYDDNGVIGSNNDNTVNLHEFIFGNNDSEDEISSISELCGFNIANKSLNFYKLFTKNDTSIISIHDVFTNLIQSENNSNIAIITIDGNNINSINNVGITNLNRLETFKNVFSVTENSSLDSTKKSNRLIDIINLFDWDTQAAILFNKDNQYSFNFYKIVDLDNTIAWKGIWSKLKDIEEISSVFINTVFKTTSNTVTIDTPEQNASIKYAHSLFANSTMFVNNKETGLKLSNNTLKGLKGEIVSIDKIFYNSYLYAGSSYPIPDELFTTLTKLQSVKEAFAYTTLLDDNESTDNVHASYNNGTLIETKVYTTDKNYIYKSIITENNIDKSYPILPPTIFDGLSSLSFIDGFIRNSEFEGYIPQNLLNSNSLISTMKSVFEECRVVPQLVKTITAGSNISESQIYEFNNAIDNKIFTFIPSQFITGSHKKIIYEGLYNLFNFYATASQEKNSRIYLFVNDSFDLTTQNTTIKFNSVSPLYHPLSKVIQQWLWNINHTEQNINIDDTSYEGSLSSIYINVYFDIINNKEGLPISILNHLTNTCILIDDKLSGIIYGYLFEYGTIFDSFVINGIENKVILIQSGSRITKAGSNDSIYYPYKGTIYNMILPTIIYYPAITNDDLLNNYGGEDIKEFKNKLAIENVCSFANSLSIYDKNIDKSFINNISSDNLTIIEEERDGQIEQTGWNYKDSYFDIIIPTTFNGRQITTDEQAFNQCKELITQLIYSNYQILFNNWTMGVSIPDNAMNASYGTEDTYWIIYSTMYPNVKVFNSSSNAHILVSTINDYSITTLKEGYSIHYKSDDYGNNRIISID